MFDFLFGAKRKLVTAEEALPGRAERPFDLDDVHHVLGTSLTAVPPGAEVAVVALGCFWGAEKAFWKLPGVISTSVGYAGGHTPHPTYREVCTGQTGHTEVVRVVFDPAKLSYEQLLRVFVESHDPTQGMRQGHDVGTQYRSAVYTVPGPDGVDRQRPVAERVLAAYGAALRAAGHPDPVTTELAPLREFFYAEDYHQQYLSKNPDGYCGLGGTGVSCPVGLDAKA